MCLRFESAFAHCGSIPISLDPSRHTARVTREVAAKLATLARTLEQEHPPKRVAEFLTRCIFTSFAEDIGLLPTKSWLRLLEDLRDREEAFSLGILSSSIHLAWTAANSGRIGFGNDPVYVKTRCFDPFPFPGCAESQKQNIRELAERLDAHRSASSNSTPG